MVAGRPAGYTTGMVSIGCPDPQAYVRHVKSFVDTRFDHGHVQRIGPDQDAFFDFWATEIRPAAAVPA